MRLEPPQLAGRGAKESERFEGESPIKKCIVFKAADGIKSHFFQKKSQFFFLLKKVFKLYSVEFFSLYEEVLLSDK